MIWKKVQLRVCWQHETAENEHGGNARKGPFLAGNGREAFYCSATMANAPPLARVVWVLTVLSTEKI
jgi:hypothetical protein